MRSVWPDLERPVVKTAQHQRHVDDVGAWVRRAAGRQLPMRRLQERALQAGIAGDKFAEAVLAQQLVKQAHDQRIGKQIFVPEWGAKLWKNPPASGTLPEYCLLALGNLIPAVPVPALDAVPVDAPQRKSQFFHLLRRQDIAQHDAAGRMEQKSRPPVPFRLQSSRRALAAAHRQGQLLHRSCPGCGCGPALRLLGQGR